MPFFNADDGKHAYFVSARDLDHAKQILADADVQLHDSTGIPRTVHHHHVCHPTMWMEIDDQTAKRIAVHGMNDKLVTLHEGLYVRVTNASRSPSE